MGKHITKAAGNVFAEARYHAGTFNDRLLSSRRGVRRTRNRPEPVSADRAWKQESVP